VVLNDTVATLLAAKTAGSMEHFDTYLGFILGTGLNCAYIERNSSIGKLSGLDPDRSQIINMESGGFDGFTGGEVDDEFDAGTKSPGFYRLEKMVSGAYLGPLAFAVLGRAARDGLFSREAAERIERIGEGTTIQMDEFLHAPATADSRAASGAGSISRIADACLSEEEKLTAFLLMDNVVERAGKLAALNLTAAVLQSGAGTDPTRPAAICADGTTFYKTHRLKFYTEYYLKKELEERRGRYVQLVGLDNAPVIGAAVAGLTN
jgi:hexokinase